MRKPPVAIGNRGLVDQNMPGNCFCLTNIGKMNIMKKTKEIQEE